MSTQRFLLVINYKITLDFPSFNLDIIYANLPTMVFSKFGLGLRFQSVSWILVYSVHAYLWLWVRAFYVCRSGSNRVYTGGAGNWLHCRVEAAARERRPLEKGAFALTRRKFASSCKSTWAAASSQPHSRRKQECSEWACDVSHQATERATDQIRPRRDPRGATSINNTHWEIIRGKLVVVVGMKESRAA